MSYEFAVNPTNIGLSMSNFKREFSLAAIPPVPPYNGALAQQVLARSSMVSVDYASQIGFAVGTASTTGKVKVFLVEYMRQSEALAATAGADVYSARYAAGFRIALRITENNTEAKVNLAYLAAQATLQEVTVSIDIMLLGLNAAPAIPAGVLAFSDFNADKLATLNKLIDDLTTFMSTPANAANLNPVLISVTPRDDLPAVIVHNTRAVNAALKALTKGQGLAALIAALPVGLSEEIARKTYAVVYEDPALVIPTSDPAGEARKPRAGEKTRAVDILDGQS